MKMWCHDLHITTIYVYLYKNGGLDKEQKIELNTDRFVGDSGIKCFDDKSMCSLLIGADLYYYQLYAKEDYYELCSYNLVSKEITKINKIERNENKKSLFDIQFCH